MDAVLTGGYFLTWWTNRGGMDGVRCGVITCSPFYTSNKFVETISE